MSHNPIGPSRPVTGVALPYLTSRVLGLVFEKKIIAFILLTLSNCARSMVSHFETRQYNTRFKNGS
jgi:hypothetical protein